MSPRQLQQQIHSTFSTSGSVWGGFRTDIINLYNSGMGHVDFNDHLVREFNKKIRDFNFDSGLYFSPYDGGLRFIGSELGVPADEGFVFVYAGGEQVLLNNGDQVQVPEQYANA
jgi:hypothetical protein